MQHHPIRSLSYLVDLFVRYLRELLFVYALVRCHTLQLYFMNPYLWQFLPCFPLLYYREYLKPSFIEFSPAMNVSYDCN